MVPSGWKQTTLDKVLTIGGGKDYKHLEKGSIPVYGSGGYMLSVSDYLYDGESVCIGRKGTIDKPLFLKGKFWTVDTLFYTHSFKDSVPYFIYQFFQTVPWRSLSEASGVPSLSKSVINKVKINLPPLPEQRKIVIILGTWDKAISTTERLIDNSKQQKKALMQQLLTGKKRLLDDSGKPFEGEWKEAKLSDVAEVITGNTPSTKNREYYDGNILFVSPADLGTKKYISDTAKKLSDLGFSKTRKIKKGSTLFTCIGSTIGKVGLAKEDLATNQQINSVTPKENNDNEFIYYQLLFHAKQIKRSAATQAVPIINKTNFESQLIPFPPTEKEQHKISVGLINTDKEIELLNQQLADLKQEKKALMQQLLTGKRRVKI